MTGGVLRAWFLIRHPETEPYYDRQVLAVLTVLMVVFLFVTLGLTILGLRLRKTPGPHRLYIHVVNQSWWLAFGVLAYLHGLPTTPLWTFFPFLGFLCLLLFDEWVTAAGALGALAVIYATTVAERLDLIPYPPVFGRPPRTRRRVTNPRRRFHPIMPTLSFF